MRRTQLYLDDDLWNALHTRARKQRTTISDLVRQAVRDRYLGNLEDRCKAMEGLVGIWKDRTWKVRTGLPDSTEEYVRSMRRGTRLKRHWKR